MAFFEKRRFKTNTAHNEHTLCGCIYVGSEIGKPIYAVPLRVAVPFCRAGGGGMARRRQNGEAGNVLFLFAVLVTGLCLHCENSAAVQLWYVPFTLCMLCFNKGEKEYGRKLAFVDLEWQVHEY